MNPELLEKLIPFTQTPALIAFGAWMISYFIKTLERKDVEMRARTDLYEEKMENLLLGTVATSEKTVAALALVHESNGRVEHSNREVCAQLEKNNALLFQLNRKTDRLPVVAPPPLTA